MTKNDWYEAGDQIKKLVQDAVESQDFSQLSSTITNVVDQTVNGLQSALKESLKGQNSNTQRSRAETQNEYTHHAGNTPRDRYQYTNSEAAEKIRQRMQEKRQNSAQSKDRVQKPVAVKVKVPGEISGKVMKYYGYSVSGMLGLAFGIVSIVGIATGFNLILPAGILAFLFGVHYVVGQNGKDRVEMANRFRKYVNVIGDRTYCLVEELAGAIGKNSKFVRKDLKKMIGKGYFKEGYLDGKETLLITDKSTYQQYLTTQTEYEKRTLAQEAAKRVKERSEQAAQSKAETERRERKNLSAECRDLIAEGERYIQYIHECNDRIPGEEMSAKLDRLELVVSRIFREVEKDPSIVSDLKKMMSYYLPTMKKLLDAYCEMDAQPIRGQNIEKTKQEIEAAVDTINAAFENLLDSFFEEKAWDISSDISVLNTMLAQEGLKGQDFRV